MSVWTPTRQAHLATVSKWSCSQIPKNPFGVAPEGFLLFQSAFFQPIWTRAEEIGRLTPFIANASQKASQSALRRFGGFGRVGMLVLLLSVFFQSYVAQTHIHDAGRLFAQVTAATTSATGPDAPAPGDEDNANCLLCQASLHAGSFAAPAILAILLPAMLFLGLAEALPCRPARILLASHGWRSRAPPRS